MYPLEYLCARAIIDEKIDSTRLPSSIQEYLDILRCLIIWQYYQYHPSFGYCPTNCGFCEKYISHLLSTAKTKQFCKAIKSKQVKPFDWQRTIPCHVYSFDLNTFEYNFGTPLYPIIGTITYSLVYNDLERDDE